MRKLLLPSLLLFVSAVAFAQQDYVGRYDAFAGFSYLDSPKLNLTQRGFNTQVGVNLRRWLAVGFDFSTQSGSGTLVPSDLKPSLQALLPPVPGLFLPFDATTRTYTGGAQLTYRHFKRITLFAHPTVGAIHEAITLKPHDATTAAIVAGLIQAGEVTTASPSDTTYFYGAGGGFDINATKHIHLRFDAEYVHTFLFSDLLADPRNGFRLSVGPSFNFGRNVRH